MSTKQSKVQFDGITWEAKALPLGKIGLDLRRPGDPAALTVLDNAVFVDDSAIARRDGHSGQLIQDGSEFTTNKTTTSDWVYGHGTVIKITGDQKYENSRHPIHKRGGGTFSFNDTDIVWTGDRLLIVSDDGPFYGASTHWDRTT